MFIQCFYPEAEQVLFYSRALFGLYFLVFNMLSVKISCTSELLHYMGWLLVVVLILCTYETVTKYLVCFCMNVDKKALPPFAAII